MAHLVLHIGAHKTGTTHLQHLFHLNADLLHEHGIYYPHLGPNAAHHVLAMPWIDIPELDPAFLLGGSVEGLWDEFLSQCLPLEGTVFLSGELFSRAESQRVDMQDLANRLSGFESVKIVYTVRNQVDLIQSIWLQIAKSGQAQPLAPFVNYAISAHLATGVWVEHGKVLDHIETGFSPSQIHVLDYETIRKSELGMVGTFLNLLGLDLTLGQLRPVLKEHANISPDPLSTFYASVLLPNKAPPKELLRDIQIGLSTNENLRSTLFTPAEVARIDAEFSPLNDALVNRVRTYQPDFEMRAPTWDENLVFRGGVPHSSFIKLARRLLNQSGII